MVMDIKSWDLSEGDGSISFVQDFVEWKPFNYWAVWDFEFHNDRDCFEIMGFGSKRQSGWGSRSKTISLILYFPLNYITRKLCR